MAKQRMYLKGKEITSIQELAGELEAGRYVFFGDRVNHPGWIVSMQLRVLLAQIKRHRLHYAVKNPSLEI